MNFLPIVFAFILIFSILSTGFLHEYKNSELTSGFLQSFNKTHRAVSNAIARKLYSSVPKDNTMSSTGSVNLTEKTTSTSSAFQSRRVLYPTNNSKLNLSPLLEIQTDPKDHPLYEICAQFFRNLYQDPLFKSAKQENLEYELLNAIIKKFRVKNDIKSLSELYPEAPHLKGLFYQMLKGTNQYNVALAQGVPPLEDFFCLEKSAAIHFAFASPPLLEAVFGKKLTIEILATEKKKWETSGKNSSLTKDELTALLSSDPTRSSLVLTLDQQLDFSQKTLKRKVVIGKDSKSGLIVKKPLG